MRREAKSILSANDAFIKQVIATVPEPDISSTHNVFHDLLSCVLEQQIHYRSTKKVFQKMLTVASLEELSLTNFEQFEERGLAGKKLSAQKYQTLEQLIKFFQNSELKWENLTDAEVRTLLIKMKGISNWTADMILMYTLERESILPLDDYHLKQLMSKHYQAEGRKAMRTVAENWAPYQSYAVKYLFAWKEFHKRK